MVIEKEYNGIKYVIDYLGVCIYDSWKVTDDETKEDFLMHICLENEGLELCRSRKSMFIEWKAHNILYQKHLFRKRTCNTDMEWKQSKFIAFMYKVICRLFKEKSV
jgi:hypothetical protein